MDPAMQKEPAAAGESTSTAPKQQGAAQNLQEPVRRVEGGAAGEEKQTPNGDTVIGEQFRGWFNDKVRQLPNPSITLGTKQAHVISLHQDGRLECSIVGASAEEGGPQFVAFETTYLDQLLRKITVLSVP